MDDICISPAMLAVVTPIVAGLFGALMHSLWDTRKQRDRAMDGWESTLGLGERAVVKRERRRAP